MRVVVTGATGNVGASVVEALTERDEIDEVVGLARRAPARSHRKTSWASGDVVGSDLESVFDGADAVIHLAWAIQPSRDLETRKRINVDGSRRVFEAVGAAGVPKLIYASSVGAYVQGPTDHLITEDWPVGGTETSFYSHHAALVEEQLDEFEAHVPETKVVRLRPALILKEEAATEIRRLFAEPFLPSFLLRGDLIPAIPRIPRLCFQAVHSSDLGRAYALAAIRDVSGAFNLAPSRPLSIKDLAASLDPQTLPLPASMVRRIADLSWRLQLQPTAAEWLDTAIAVPLMSSERAERELGWQPQMSSVEALAELLADPGREGVESTPPPKSAGPGRRLDELRTAVGGRRSAQGPKEKLVKELADVHAIEEQALTQMRKAPKLAGDDRLAKIFEGHLGETEDHQRRVQERLKAYGADPSRFEDSTGQAGGIGIVVFAASQPDTPGKLATHAFSYEHMEIAAYELLRRTAEEAGDEATVAMARQIADEEKRMADRLEASFDAVVDVSLNGGGDEQLAARLDRCLADAHAIEKQGLQLLETAPLIVEDAELKKFFIEHLRQSEEHEQSVRERLEARNAKPSKAKDAVLRLGGLQVGAFLAAQPDTAAKLTGFAFAFEHLEIAAYELLGRVARRAGDQKVLSVSEPILAEERAAAGKLASRWDRASSPVTS